MYSDRDRLNLHINKKISRALPPDHAKIKQRNANGTYCVILPNGSELDQVRNGAYSTKWQKGQWVAIEFAGGDWLIVGIASLRGGP